MRDRLLKASELPPGTTMLPREGKALNGEEIGEAVAVAMAGLWEEMDLTEGEYGPVVAELDRRIKSDWWSKLNLTFPKVEIEVVAWRREDRLAGQVRLRLMAGDPVVIEVGDVKVIGDVLADRAGRQAGPSQVPDDLRDQLGLAMTAQFRLPTGERVLAQLPTEGGGVRRAPQQVPRPERPERPMYVPPAKIEVAPPPNPLTSPPPQVAAQLVGETAQVRPQVEKVAQVVPKAKGGRR